MSGVLSLENRASEDAMSAEHWYERIWIVGEFLSPLAFVHDSCNQMYTGYIYAKRWLVLPLMMSVVSLVCVSGCLAVAVVLAYRVEQQELLRLFSQCTTVQAPEPEMESRRRKF